MTEKFRGLLFGGLPIRIKTANVYLSGREALMNDLINAVGEKTALLDAAIRQLGNADRLMPRPKVIIEWRCQRQFWKSVQTALQ